MSTNTEEFKRGLKYVFGALPFFILAPVLTNIGFSAIKRDANYLIIGIALLAAIVGIGIAFWGFKILLNALFNK